MLPGGRTAPETTALYGGQHTLYKRCFMKDRIVIDIGQIMDEIFEATRNLGSPSGTLPTIGNPKISFVGMIRWIITRPTRILP